MKYLLDTNILIYLIKQKPLTVLPRFKQHLPGDIGISSISVAELQYGVAKSSSVRNQRVLDDWLAMLHQPAFDSAAASEYGSLRAHLETAGTPIGPLDTLIAAHSLALGATLVTNNVREFARVPGLKIENWTLP